MIRRAIIAFVLFLSLGIGSLAINAPPASAHSWVVYASCWQYTINGMRHVDVRWGFDYHESYMRPMTYNEFVYYCGGF